MNLYEQIEEIQKGNDEYLIDIVKLFENILNKYSRQLNGEDTKQDLIIFMIVLLRKIPIDRNKFYNEKQILSYISKSIKSEYIRLAKINSKKLLNEMAMDQSFDLSYDDNNLLKIETNEVMTLLTEKEKNVINLNYIKGFSISEMAELTNISRQATNQRKNSALKKLEKYLSSTIK